MKKKSIRVLMLLFAVAMVSLSACEKAELEEQVDNTLVPKSKVKTVANLTIDPGMDFAAINSVLNAASAGDVVQVQTGTYEITGKLSVKPNISLQFSGAGLKPVFKAPTGRTELLELLYGSELTGVVFSGIEFNNIRFKIVDAGNITFENCLFSKGRRKPATDKKYLKDAYVEFLRTTNCTIKLCEFKREVGNSGRGIYNKKSTNNQFIDNSFDGYFTTAINENSIGTLIENNTINRELTWVSKAETDHGIYAHTFTNLKIINNRISGWPANGSGGSVKARNGSNLEIEGNLFRTSGILLYVYNHKTHPFLEDVKILNNTIEIASIGTGLYYGIGYWRNTASGSEKSIEIRNNILPTGSIYIKFASLNIVDFNTNGGGVYNNDFGAVYLKSGISRSGNY
jgi:hypothetical protein